MTNTQPSTTVDAYLQSFPDDTRAILENVREIIRRLAPDVVETMSYGIPTFDRSGKHLVFLAGWKRHISLYPIPAGDSTFQQDTAPYKKGKGTIQFPLNKPVPYDLVARMVSFLLMEA